jgi:hypothetical protein
LAVRRNNCQRAKEAWFQIFFATKMAATTENFSKPDKAQRIMVPAAEE